MVTLTGCDEVARIFEPMPVGAIRFQPDTAYLTWWRDIEKCSGRRASMRGVEWYFYPGTDVVPGSDGRPALRRRPDDAIFFADSAAYMSVPWRADTITVQHEMMHVIVGESGHRRIWGERCPRLAAGWKDF